MQSQKLQNDLCSFPRQTIQYHRNQVYAPTSNAEEAEVEWFYGDLQDLLELMPKRDVLFITGAQNVKEWSQEIPGVNRQVWPWSSEWSRQKLIEFSQENALVIANTLFRQHETTLDMVITRWSISKSDWLYSLLPKMETLYRVSKNKTGSWLWLRSWTPYCQIRPKLKIVGKTTRPFRYDLNQIPYDYTLEVTNRFKGLDLIDRVPEELWSEVPDIVHEAVINAIPRKINAKGQNDCLRRLYK